MDSADSIGLPDAGRRRAEVSVTRIADLAGVSVPTVSKVINGRSGVSAATRARIEELIREHGYRKPENSETTPSVELVFQALDSLWALEIVRGVEQVVGPRGLAVSVTQMQGRLTPGRSWAQEVLARRPVGVIAVSAELTGAQLAHLSSRAIPVVALDPTGEPVHRVPSVGAMNWNGGLLAARHLLDLGHRRIAMVNGPAELFCCRARLDGFRAAMDAAGVPVDDRLVRQAPLYVEGGLREGRHLLELPDPPTAVFTANDLQALGVYEAARAAGLRVPQDLSVIGFDDLLFTQWSVPALTTVRQPLLQMGATAAEMVLDLASGRPPAQDRVELSTTLVVRQSTAPPRPDR
ncbi:LacI family transcriptional regulator [Catellatospora sp. TT07R-123]|uniref:LacI family DNA-binding transcriptional regulator n=1 Tax=Catellatospora sp. TT07R-123 TaxID=2733863 RepID=UPI001AFDFC71|nr:LacI family DNA-binding transcriptional regulator [Catellatospora sp. TT07R-123]GHJ49104.1 LacI family transcriptional regulator [Catellatospora sp. TT07R-123]